MKQFIILTVACFLSSQMFSQHELKTSQINIFKNGNYFVVKEGQVKLKNKTTSLTIPNAPLLGTYWLTTAKGVNIESIVFMTDTIKKKKAITSYFDLIQVNLGKQATIFYNKSNAEQAEIRGILESFNLYSGIIKIKSNDGNTIYFPSKDLKFIQIDKNPIDIIETDSFARLANITFDKSHESTQLKLTYMQGGIQWIPTYNIKILNDKELQLEMKALIENYAETIEDADLVLTVGDPQFLWGKTIDPMSLNYQTNIYQIRPQQAHYASQTYSWSNTRVSAEMDMAGGGGYNDYANYTTPGEKSNDLYFYKLGKTTLPMNSKTSKQIFAADITYKDVYEVSLEDAVNYASNYRVTNNPENIYDVFHSLKLKNTTSFPFTTAPVFVLNEKLQPLAQDIIKYTATGSEVMVQLSKSGDVKVKNEEEEIAKENNKKKYGNAYYNSITVKGTINVENNQNKKIQLVVRKNINADVTKTSHGGIFKKSGQYAALNPTSNIKWEIDLIPGEKKVITYEYEVFVHAN